MSNGFVKLYGTILDSSIWGERPGTRLVWITMLAMADEDGVVIASSGGLARRANVPREEVDEALRVLAAPDPDSKSPEYEGRRIERIDGGWLILNHRKYRDMRTPKQVATAERVAAHRARTTAKARVTANACNAEAREASVSASASESGSPERGTGGDQPGPEAPEPEAELQRNAKVWLVDPNRASLEAPEPWTWRAVLEVFAHFSATFGGAPIVASRWQDPRVQAVIGRFAEGSTADDLRVAIDGAKLDEFISKRPEFQTIVTVLRDANQIDRFTRRARAGPAPKRPRPNSRTAPLQHGGTNPLANARKHA